MANWDFEQHLLALLKSAGMSSVHLDVLTRSDSFRGGEVSEEAQAVTGPARDEHRARHFGFWEFVLAASIETSQPTRAGLIQGALRHNGDNTIQTVLSLEKFAVELKAGSFRGLPARHIVSLTSIATDLSGDRSNEGEPWHLPMLDMGAPTGEQGLAACVDALTELDVHGAVFSSGRSYHFVGNQPLPQRDLVKFLARAQLLSPIVDARWVSHQLLDGRCGLRISTDTEKHQRGHELAATL